MKHLIQFNQKIFSAVFIVLTFCVAVFGQTTTFTYQGRFTDSTVVQPTNGTYNMQFALFDAGGAQIGATVTNASVQVTNSIFTVSLDFGANSFDGTARFLEVRVFSTTTNAYVIRNQTGQQASANFNISGNGTAGGTLSGGIINAATQYNLGGNRLLSVAGTGNTFVGIEAGLSNTMGNENTFIGNEAGRFNTNGLQNVFVGTLAGALSSSGEGNSFLGRRAGANNSTGNNNAFFGKDTGFVNTTGSANTFVGVNSGGTNTSGTGNSFFGTGAGAGNTTGSYNTFIGAGIQVPQADLNYATAIGAGAVARFSNTIVLGRETGEDLVRIFRLGSTGTTQLCLNLINEISNCSSSLRYKTNIKPFDSGLSFINQLRPISFDWKTGGTKDIGFGAEDVAAINPLFVNYNAAGEVEGVKYDRLSVVFVNAFKEQQTQIEQQKTVNQNLQTQVERQQRQIDDQRLLIDGLKKLVCANNATAAVCQ